MIHIATVHWQNDSWIDLQLSYLKRYLSQPFRVYAFLNDIPQKHYEKFYYVCDEPIEEHGIKLNLLAEIIASQAGVDDILLFIDGDAFPIAPLSSFMEEKLAIYPLTAVVRKENLGDRHPHPCFCATTVGFWKQIKGDWKLGYCWTDDTGILVSDTGANLLQKLEEGRIDWHPVYRSHSLANHPLWYGIYGSLIYHHGAGFRPPADRVDVQAGPFWLKYLWLSVSKSRSLHFVLSKLWDKTLEKQIATASIDAHQEVYSKIAQESDFFNKHVSDQ
jgi:hypothetical protein